MHYFLYPSKDAFVTNDSKYIFKNTGLDEILEVEKNVISTNQGGYSGSISTRSVLSRALLQFDLTTISQSLATGTILNPKFYLSLKTAEAKQVPVGYTLAAYPLALPWVMGTEYLYDGNQTADGVNWKFSDGQNVKWWVSESLVNFDGGGIWYVSSSLLGSGSGYAEPPFVSPIPYDPFPFCTNTGSITGSPAPIQPVTGGFACYQVFDYQSSDVHMDITTIINAWLSETIPNNGLIVLHSGEFNSVNYGKLRFFSKETNTIYSPHVDMSWEDSYFNTGSGTGSYDPVTTSGSFSPINIYDTVISIKNMASEYRYGSIVRFNVVARERYPLKTFTNKLSDYLEVFFLPYDSYYAIRDAETSEAIIPYDGYTRLSFDSSGNYFSFDTTGFPQERYFIISIRSEQRGSILTYDIPTTFKIVR